MQESELVLGHMEWRIDGQTGVMSWNSCLDMYLTENFIYGEVTKFYSWTNFHMFAVRHLEILYFFYFLTLVQKYDNTSTLFFSPMN